MYKILTPPASEPVTLIEAKAHVRVTHNNDDAYITLLIKAAREHVEAMSGRALMPQTWELYLDAFPLDNIKLAYPPMTSVTHVKYLDTAGALQTILNTDYAVDSISEPGWVMEPVNGWPTAGKYANAVVVRFITGYADAASVPESLKMAMKLVIGHLYVNRESTISGTIISKLPMGVDTLIDAVGRVMEF